MQTGGVQVTARHGMAPVQGLAGGWLRRGGQAAAAAAVAGPPPALGGPRAGPRAQKGVAEELLERQALHRVAPQQAVQQRCASSAQGFADGLRHLRF